MNAPVYSAAARRSKKLPPLRVGVGGPVGSGKTTLLEMLCKAMREKYDLVAITNDIYTKEDQRLLTVAGALPAERIMGVETGGCPHTAIREDASINLEAVDQMIERFPDADIVFIESGGDNLAATFSPELSDLTIYVIDVAGGEKFRARVVRASRSPTCWSSTRSTLHRMSAQISTSWPPMPGRCAENGHLSCAT